MTCYLHDVQSVLQQRKLSSGELQREIKLPCNGPVSVSSCSLKRKLSEAFFSVTSFTVPGATFRCVAVSCSNVHEPVRRIFLPTLLALLSAQFSGLDLSSRPGLPGSLFTLH